MSKAQYAVECADKVKDALYDLGESFEDAFNANDTNGLRPKDFCESAHIDNSLVTFCRKLIKRFSRDDLYKYKISELKKLVSDKEPSAPKEKFLTIKLNAEQQKIFDAAYEKFCNENGLDPETSRSYFVETRCAEYLAEVGEVLTVDATDPDLKEFVDDMSGPV